MTLIKRKYVKISLLALVSLVIGIFIFRTILIARAVPEVYSEIYRDKTHLNFLRRSNGEQDEFEETKISINNLSYWSDWKWEEKITKLEVVSLDKENSSINAIMLLPSGSSFSNLERSYKVECAYDETTVYYMSVPRSELPEFEGFKPAMDIITAGDLFYAYCLDEDCTTLGRVCRIERFPNL